MKNKKRICITGGCGFVGHHCVEGILKETDWDIVILDSINYAGNLNRLSDIDIFGEERHRIQFVYHDLRAAISEETHRQIGQVDYVFHLAAESHVDKSLEDCIPFLQSNVVGTGNLLQYVKHKQPDIEKIIVFSTDEVFGPAPERVYYKEGDTPNPSNSYAASKEGEEAVAKAFAFSFGLPIMICRSMNIIGERQNSEKFIPKTISSILANKKIVLHGGKDKTSSRCWIHARNVCKALLFLIEKGEVIEKRYQNDRQRGIYHIVGGEYDVEYLANWISMIIRKRELLDEEIEFIDFHSGNLRPGHDFRYSLSGGKITKMGFKFNINFKNSFEKMVKWMCDEKHRYWLNL